MRWNCLQLLFSIVLCSVIEVNRKPSCIGSGKSIQLIGIAFLFVEGSCDQGIWVAVVAELWFLIWRIIFVALICTFSILSHVGTRIALHLRDVDVQARDLYSGRMIYFLFYLKFLAINLSTLLPVLQFLCLFFPLKSICHLQVIGDNDSKV